MAAYKENPGKAVEIDGRFKHAMAITLDPASHYHEGIIRCIMSRTGDVDRSGNVDRSELHVVKGGSLEHFTIGERLKIKNEDEIVSGLAGKKGDFIGLEDPDIWRDERTGRMHIYFTIPILEDVSVGKRGGIAIHLGHAVGKSIDSLEMTEPTLLSVPGTEQSAKEVAIVPINKHGVRYNLIESYAKGVHGHHGYSTVRVAIAEDMGKPWEYGETVFHPGQHHIPWIGEHASPGPLLPRDFLDVGEGKMAGFINGREASRIENGVREYGVFSVGLFVYDYEQGKMDWVSPKPFIRDSEAKNMHICEPIRGAGEGDGHFICACGRFVRAGVHGERGRGAKVHNSRLTRTRAGLIFESERGVLVEKDRLCVPIALFAAANRQAPPRGDEGCAGTKTGDIGTMSSSEMILILAATGRPTSLSVSNADSTGLPQRR